MLNRLVIGATYIPLITKITENANEPISRLLRRLASNRKYYLNLRMPLVHIYAFCLFVRRNVVKSALA